MLRHGAAERNEFALAEYRHNDTDIGKMCPAKIGIVHYIDVAIAHSIQWKLLNDSFHDRYQRCQVYGNSDSLGQRFPIDGKQTCGRVQTFTHNRRSEEQTSELQSLMSITNAVFCLKKKKKTT